MYGGGEFDGNVAFTGGGFMPSQATTQAHDSSSSSTWSHGESENKKTYGGGEFYGNSVFAGGGFMPSQATNQAHDSSSSFKNRTLLPLTLKQFNSVSTNSESDFSIDGVDVAITGRVSIVENRTTRVNFVVEDGTGSVECVRWCQEHQEAEEMEAVKLGMYVHLLGHLKSLQGKRFVNVFSIRPVTDLNEIANPLVASSSINMEESSDVENKIDSAESKLAEEIRKSSEQEMRLKEVGRPERIRELIAMGASFDPGEAGHLHRKIVHVADITGREIQKALLEAPLNHPNEIYSAESKLAEEIRKNSELETRLKELETRLQQERLLFAKERESQEAILHKQREYLDALEKELGAKEESMLRSRRSRAMDGMMFNDVTIPDRSTALKNLPLKFHGAYNKLTVNKVKTYLEPWVWEEAKSSNKTGNFYLSDDFIFAHLCWQIQEPVVSHRKQLRKLAGHVRDQHGHRICWGYVGSDLVAIKRVIRGWKKEYVPLCPWFLSHFVPSDDPTFRRGHKCRNTSLIDCLEYIQREGVPEEIPGHEVFDCTKRPPSSDQPKFKIKSVVNIETFEEALEELETQAIGASLIMFPELLTPGKRIYYGPKTKGAQFRGFHSVVMIGVDEIDGELVVVCKLSNGKEVADGGYAYVSVSTVYMVIAADPKEEDRHRATPRPQHLLSGFYYVDIDQAPRNLKRKHEQKIQDRGGSSKKPRV